MRISFPPRPSPIQNSDFQVARSLFLSNLHCMFFISSRVILFQLLRVPFELSLLSMSPQVNNSHNHRAQSSKHSVSKKSHSWFPKKTIKNPNQFTYPPQSQSTQSALFDSSGEKTGTEVWEKESDIFVYWSGIPHATVANWLFVFIDLF